MTNNLTENEIAELKEAFTMFDRENTGKINQKQMDIIMRNLGQNDNEDTVNEMFEANTSNDNKIDFAEFLNTISQKMQDNGTEDEIREAFKIFDKDETGFISTTELRDIMTNMGQKLTVEEVNEMIRESNPDDDGKINYNEFVNKMFSK